jgi:hypothetical protein
VTQCMPNSFARTRWLVPSQITTTSAMSWMGWHRSRWISSWIRGTSGVVQLVGLTVFVIVNWCATGLQPGMPLKHLCTTQDLVPDGLLNHCDGFCSTFPKIGTKSDAHSFLSLVHRENCYRSHTQLQTNVCENCLRPPSYVQRYVTNHQVLIKYQWNWFRQELEWFSVRFINIWFLFGIKRNCLSGRSRS